MTKTLRKVKGKFVVEKFTKKRKKINKKSIKNRVKRQIEEELDDVDYNGSGEFFKLKKQSVIKTKYLKNGIFKKDKKLKS